MWYNIGKKQGTDLVAQLSYQAALAFIHGRTQFKKEPTLRRMQRFMELLGHPERKVHAIHVTGTNGKGSTTAFIRDILMQHGFSVGTYTSPFIEKFNDRICINGQMISDEALAATVAMVQPAVAQLDKELADEAGGPTEFEIITAVMFTYFAHHPVDYVVVEVGMGGTYDSTNVVAPVVSVITNVAHDHAKFLGTTLEQIAHHKAGIIKENTPVITHELAPEAQAVVAKRAQAVHAQQIALNHDFTATALAQNGAKWGEAFAFKFFAPNYAPVHIDRCFSSLLGSHQIANAAGALAAVIVVATIDGWHFDVAAARTALAQTKWAGRFERLNDEPLVVLDGAHNPAAIKQQTATIKRHFAKRQVYIILAVLADKNAAAMVEQLLKLPNVHLIVTHFDIHAHRQVTTLEYFKEHFPTVARATNWQSALAQALQEMSADDVLLFTGSLYFISDVRNYFIQ